MPSNPPGGKSPSSPKAVPPTSRRSARQQRLANREANRAMMRASTRGGGGGGAIILWTAIAVVIAVVVVGGVFLITQSKTNDYTGTPITPTVVTPSDIPTNGLTLGNPAAPVTVDVYEDFRCKFCYAFTVESGTESKLVDNYIKTGKAKMVWHDLIVIDTGDGTTESRDAANAARCAADQGKFWPMHDWLFANQSPLEAPGAFTISRLKAIGADVPGMDKTKFNSCIDQGTHNSEIAEEQNSIPTGVSSTPSVLVNGKLVSGYDYASVAAMIDNPNATPLPSGVTPAPSATATASVAPSATASPAPSASAS